MKAKLVLLVLMGFLGACAAPAAMDVSDGDQENGVVVLSAQYNVVQPPSLNVQQGMQTAAAQCQSWGYAGAVPSGKPAQTCTNRLEGGNCIAWEVTSKFQCTGMAEQ